MGNVAIGKYTLGRLKGEWCVYWREGGQRRRFRLGEGTAEEARGKLAAFVAKHGRLTAEHATSLEDIYKAYRTERERQGKSTRNVTDSWKRLKPHFSNLPVIDLKVTDAGGNVSNRGRTIDIGSDQCRAYVEARAKTVKPGTIWTELIMLRTICNWAAKKANPPLLERAPYITIPQKPAPKDRWLTHEEARKLLDAARMPHVKLFIILALTTAGRAGAILDLKWDRVDFEHGNINLRNPELSVTTKGRAVVPMNPLSRPALTEAKAGALTPYVIEWSGERVLKIRKGFESAVQRAGLGDDVTPHVLRHTAAVWMAQAGVPMPEISQYLGHSNSAITERVYAKFSPKHLSRAAEALTLPPHSLVSAQKRA